MRLSVKTTRCDLTPEISAYIDERVGSLQKLIHAEDDDAVICEVEIEKVAERQHGLIWRAEMNLTINGTLYRADAVGENINAALDEVKDEMMKRLRRSNKKHRDLFRRGALKMKNFIRFGR